MKTNISHKLISAAFVAVTLLTFGLSATPLVARAVAQALPATSPVTPPNNSTLTIAVNSLSTGVVGRPYREAIIANDYAMRETLQLEAKNLPRGLSVNECQLQHHPKKGTNEARTSMLCYITGVPREVTNNEVILRAFVGKERFDKRLPLNVIKR